MRTFGTVSALAWVVGFAGAAAAGPIPGSFQVDYLGSSIVPGGADAGQLVFTPPAGGGAGGPGGVSGLATTVTFTPNPGGLSGPGLPGWPTDPANVTYLPTGVALTTRFAVNARVTDLSSGESGVLEIDGKLTTQLTHLMDGSWGWPLAWITSDGNSGGLVLGGNYYYGDVQQINPALGVQPATAEVGVKVITPEPGTLALAALGLAPLVARRARSRASVRSPGTASEAEYPEQPSGLRLEPLAASPVCQRPRRAARHNPKNGGLAEQTLRMLLGLVFATASRPIGFSAGRCSLTRPASVARQNACPSSAPSGCGRCCVRPGSTRMSPQTPDGG